MSNNWNTLCVVTSESGTTYLGNVINLEEWKSSGFKEPVNLYNPRLLFHQNHPQIDPRSGSVHGVLTVTLLLPVDGCIDKGATISVKASSWYFPGESEKRKEQMIKLIELAETNELKASAREAGLVTEVNPPSGFKGNEQLV